MNIITRFFLCETHKKQACEEYELEDDYFYSRKDDEKRDEIGLGHFKGQACSVVRCDNDAEYSNMQRFDLDRVRYW